MTLLHMDSIMRNSVYVLITFAISLFVLINSECPPPDLIKPCTCTEMQFDLVDCGGIDDMETLVRIFNRTADRKFHSFALYNSTVQYLPASAISSKGFEQIMLVNVTMTSMFDQHPDASNKVVMITLMESRFLRDVGWEFFRNLKKLKVISATNTGVKSLGKSFVDNVSGTLRRFHLMDAKVRKMQYNAFSHMPELYDIRIYNSQIKFLKRSLFARPSQLVDLYFPDNQIESLPDDLFSDMPRIQHINLSRNRISTLSEAVFGDIYDRLTTLDIEGNPIMCDCTTRWLVSKDRYKLKGSCAAPEDRKGKSLRNLTARDFTYCD